MSYQAESSLILYDGQIISATRGSPSAVEFDFEAAWDLRKKLGKKFFKPELLTWLHVHPPGFGVQASSQDRKCVQAIRAGLGPIIGEFGIFSFDDTSLNSIAGSVAWYQYRNGRMEPKEEGGRVASYYGREAYILKALSYVPMKFEEDYECTHHIWFHYQGDLEERCKNCDARQPAGQER